jgi:3-hydroxypropanoate dehydrogenase
MRGPRRGLSGATPSTFNGTPWRSNFVRNVGRGDPSRLHPRDSRLDFAEACRIA